SEREFAKGLQLLDEDPELYARMERWVEAADWIVWQLTGWYVCNACTAGYKGILQDGAYPTRDFLAELDPRFADFVTTARRAARRRSGRIPGRERLRPGTGTRAASRPASRAC
ncbi:MAG: hypothetical protein ABI808_15365, partial [Pseudonocardiales bacterium]